MYSGSIVSALYLGSARTIEIDEIYARYLRTLECVFRRRKKCGPHYQLGSAMPRVFAPQIPRGESSSAALQAPLIERILVGG